MVAVHSFWSSLEDYRLSVKTLRLRPGNEEIFACARTGNVSRAKILFANSSANPFDVETRFGDSLLHVRYSPATPISFPLS